MHFRKKDGGLTSQVLLQRDLTYVYVLTEAGHCQAVRSARAPVQDRLDDEAGRPGGAALLHLPQFRRQPLHDVRSLRGW